jgi:HEAT repeat protein
MKTDFPPLQVGVLPAAIIAAAMGVALLVRWWWPAGTVRLRAVYVRLPWWFLAPSALGFLTMAMIQVAHGWYWFFAFFLIAGLYYLGQMVLVLTTAATHPPAWRLAAFCIAGLAAVQGCFLLANRRDATAFTQLAKDLHHSNPDVRAKAASLLDIPWEASAAVPALRAALNDDVAIVRVEAARSMLKLDRSTAADVVPVLIAALDNKDWDGKARRMAAQTLGGLGPEARSAVSALIRWVKDNEDVYEKHLAALALTSIDKDAAVVGIPALRAGLTSHDGYQLNLSIDALGRLGVRARAALPDLEALLDDERSWVREAAHAAITAIRSDDGR